MDIKHVIQITSMFIASIIVILSCILLTASCNAQQVGPSFVFSDVSIQHSDLKVYQTNNGSMMDIGTVNSTDGRIIYDPTSDYAIIFQPTIGNTYGSTPEGWISFITNNPELAALIFIIIIAAIIITILIAFIFVTRRRK